MNESNHNETHIGAVMASSVMVIGDHVDETPLGRQIKEMSEKVEREHQLTQLLGVSLRGILPYAENELDSLRDAHRRDADPDVGDEVARASERVQRAQQALNHLNLSPLSVDNITDSEFDDTFEIRFEAEDE